MVSVISSRPCDDFASVIQATFGSCDWQQAIICTNTGLLTIDAWETKFSDVYLEYTAVFNRKYKDYVYRKMLVQEYLKI